MMSWNVRTSDGVVVFDLTGEFCVYHVAKLKEALALIREKGASKIVFNLEGVEFIDSTATQFLLNTSRDFKSQSARLVLASLTAEVLETLRITRAERLLEISPSVANAVQSLVTV